MKFMKLETVKQATCLTRSTIYLLMSKGKFPTPVKIADRNVAWVTEEIELWIDDRIKNHKVDNYKVYTK